MAWSWTPLEDRSDKLKFQQIVDRVIEAIQSKELCLGDHLPSINEAIRCFGVSRDTVVKAYNELKRRGIVDSTPNKASFVANVFVSFQKRVLFLTDAHTPYKEKIYSGLIESLGDEYYVDFFAHNDDFDLLRTLYERSKSFGKHVAYLIIPTVAQQRDREYFQYVNAKNILFLDRELPHLSFPFVRQSFRSGVLKALLTVQDRFARYNEIVFVTKKFTNPVVEQMKSSLARFAQTLSLPFKTVTTMFTEREIETSLEAMPGCCFIVLHLQQIVWLIENAGQKGLVLGRDMGMIAINDEPVFKVLAGGVTSLSADFEEMGRYAAEFVTEGATESKTVETHVIIRQTL